MKRQAAPAGRQGNDGWRSVLYESGPLERVRKAYAAQFAPAADDIDEVGRRIRSFMLAELAGITSPGQLHSMSSTCTQDDLLPQPADDEDVAALAAELPAPLPVATEPTATDQWIQCDRQGSSLTLAHVPARSRLTPLAARLLHVQSNLITSGRNDAVIQPEQ